MTLDAMIRRLLDAGYKVVKRGQGKGRPPSPRKCPKCGKLCGTAVEARAHCPKRTGGK